MTTQIPTFFTNTDCPSCEALKIFAWKHDIAFVAQDSAKIAEYAERNKIMAQLAMQGMALPVVWWEGQAMSADAFRIIVVREKSK